MAIPDYQTIMLSLLKYSGDDDEHSAREAVESLADEFELSDEERKELLPSGQQEIFRNRVNWALTYIKQAALLKATRRGYFRITERGKEVLSQNPPMKGRAGGGTFVQSVLDGLAEGSGTFLSFKVTVAQSANRRNEL